MRRQRSALDEQASNFTSRSSFSPCYTWVMTTSVESALGVIERNNLRQIYVPLRDGNAEYRSQWNEEL